MFRGRYTATDLLHRGAGVETFRGTDLQTGQAVVIKKTAARQIPYGAQLRLQHEAQVLGRLEDPRIVPLLEVGEEGDALFLVMPWVPGMTLSERLRRDGVLAAADVVALGLGLLGALQKTHELSVVHRDVKPSNIIVDEGSPPARVTLIDFGFARSAALEAALPEAPVGTLAYISPEQAGLIQGEVGDRSDLYSAGVVLYECLAGRPPFVAPTVSELLRLHLAATPPSLHELGRPVPRALAELVERLLRKDPRDRYQSAAAAAADLEDIATAMERGSTDDVVIGRHDSRRTLTEPGFVGRAAELGRFEQEVQRAALASTLLLVEGESGSGKSRLLDRVAMMALQHGAWVIRGQASERSMPLPLEILDGVVAGVAQAVREDPALAGRLRKQLGDHLEAVCAALPQLRAALSPGTLMAMGSEAHGEARTLPALQAFLSALGSPQRPAVILLDDCQWLDDLSQKLLAGWASARQTEPSGSYGGVLLVASFRGEELPADSPLRQLPTAPQITLRPLDRAEVARMAESMAGALPSSAVDLLVQLSDGNPFFVGAVLEGLVEAGALVEAPEGWALEPEAMARAQASRRAGAFLAQRLAKLPAPVLELLSVGAVLGKSFALDHAASLAGQSPAEAVAGIAVANRRRLVWTDATGSRCTLIHDRVRDALLGRLSPAKLRHLHRVGAVMLERAEQDSPLRSFDIASHFDAAGDHARALPHALQAAQVARGQHALDVAERSYRMAMKGSSEKNIPLATRHQVAEGLGEVLLLRGRYEEAHEHLTRARALAVSALARARTEGNLGELAFKRGDVPAGTEALERALRLLGRFVPRRFVALIVATVVQLIVQVGHSVLPRRLVARRRLRSANSAADLLAARLYSRLAYAYWFGRGQIATFWAHLSELNLAERYPPSPELAQACSEHSISVTGLPRLLFGRGVRYAERGLAIRRELHDGWGVGQSLNFYGILLYAFGHYAEALAKFREAFRLLRRTGDSWEANIAAMHIAFCLYRQGALREAVEECRRVREGAPGDGDNYATFDVLEVWSKATGGAVSSQVIQELLARAIDDPHTRGFLLQAEGVRLIGAGHPDQAVALFAEAESTSRAVNLKNEYVSYAPLWRARALRLAAIQALATTGVLPTQPLREAAAALRRGLSRARRYRGNLPLALRERALLRALRGQPRAARRDLDLSLREAQRQGARFEVAQSLLARGELGLLVGASGAADELSAARAELQRMGAEFALAPLGTLVPASDNGPPTLSLADQFAGIVEHGRAIASALTPDEVHVALCEAAAGLLRGDSNLVLALEGDQPRLLAWCGRASSFSSALVSRAVAEGKPIASTDLASEPPSESIVLSELRSVLCAPIFANGQAIGCLYVTSRLVSDLFGESDKRLANYLVTLAGASLEKASAFARLQQLSRALEQRVGECTVDLRAANTDLEEKLRQLREAKEQLVQSAKMATVGTLVAGLSHEIRSPLAVILSQAQIHLARMPADHPVRPAMVAIERSTRRCVDLVGTLLEFARKEPSFRELVAIDELVARIVELASVKLRTKGVELQLASSPGPATVFVSRAQIESALLNILDNAIDASPRGAVVQIDVEAERREERPGWSFRISDHGIGIAPDILTHIFDPFFTTKPAGQGTGLGLALARQFVEAHGGMLAVDSILGAGTTVHLWLPASTAR